MTAAEPASSAAPGAGFGAECRAGVDVAPVGGYVQDMTSMPAPTTKTGPFADFREFMSKEEAPIRVFLVIAVTLIAVIFVAWDTTRHNPPPNVDPMTLKTPPPAEAAPTP